MGSPFEDVLELDKLTTVGAVPPFDVSTYYKGVTRLYRAFF